MITKRIASNNGFALIFTLLVVMLIALIIVTFSFIAYNELAASEKITNSVRAYYCAEAGIAKKFMELRAGTVTDLVENFTISGTKIGSYSVSVTLVSGGTFPTYRLTSVGTYKESTRTIVFTVRQTACSRFAYLSNDEDAYYWYGSQPIWFVTGDTIRGPLHTNDYLNISGNPVFQGSVSTCASSINYYNGGPPNDNPVFEESLSLGVSSVQLPTSTEIVTNIKTNAQATGGLYLTGNSKVVFLANGTMNVTNSDKGWNGQNMALPTNGAIFVNSGYVDVSGVLSGNVTLGTSSSIYVVGNLLYNTDPRTNSSSTDMLGLVAQNNVYIGSEAPYNVEVDAYIVALNTSFGVENYDSELNGTLTLYGGITQYRRGAVGTFNGTTGAKVSGYTKDYNYDSRLQNTAPLYFPPAKDSNNRIVYLKVSYSES